MPMDHHAGGPPSESQSRRFKHIVAPATSPVNEDDSNKKGHSSRSGPNPLVELPGIEHMFEHPSNSNASRLLPEPATH